MRAYLLLCALLYAQLSFGQGFNFSCARDTNLTGCATSCITLKTTIPELRGATSSYTVTKISGNGAGGTGCFAPYVQPNDNAGTSANLTIDDRYTSVINLGFNFSFFGTTYTQLIASTNGLVSFDISKANGFAHWDIVNGSTPENLPSTFYDKAIIMGPYHDLYPSSSVTTSPTKRIQYQIFGTAPHRRWVLSFYKVPLFSGTCNNLIENTHQIVLYEGTGIVEVFVFSMQNCLTWNEGRAMIGMQDINRTNAIMAPGRKASDAPWGSVNMNEAWRFAPSAGTSLFKRVELYDVSGNLVSTGTTTSNGNGSLDVSFPNICSPIGTTNFIVRPVYQKIDDPAVEIFGADTIRINKTGIAVSATAVATPSLCGPGSGSIVLSNPVGTAPFQYSIDGGNFQASNVFNNLVQGNYTVIVKDASGCTSNVAVNVGLSNNLTVKTMADTSVCPGAVFTATTTTNGIGTTTFSWTPAVGLSSATAQNPIVTVGNTSRYIVTATNGACVAKDTLDLTIGTIPSVQTIADTTVCPGASFTARTISNGTGFSWSPTTGVSNVTALSPLISVGAVTRYIVTATIGACSSKDTLNLTIGTLPTVNAGPDQIIIAGDSVQLAATASPGNYLWSPATGLSSTTVLNPIAKPGVTTAYSLQVTNAQLCTAGDAVVVTVIPYCVKPMGAFTPNGDGQNELWLVTEGACTSSVSAQVFNRYGSLVYESNDYKNNRNGTYKGNKLPDGTYYYVLTYKLLNGRLVSLKGNVTILR
ncbi:MAG: hypothetical protein JWP88_1519 [Flaviaesturariibacter sp.]|nr:hypothetical protein [Flaviaesturariibacter sp.]